MADTESSSNLIILLMIGVIIFFIYSRQMQDFNKNSNSSVENFDNTDDKKNRKRHGKNRRKNNKKGNTPSLDPVDIDGLCQAMGKRGKSRDRLNDMNRVNSEFINVQYHKDYNDTITAINYLTPQRELFNLGFLPVQEAEPDPSNMKQLVDLFMSKLNNEVNHNVTEYLNVNSGWNDMGKRRREKDGWEEQMEELGLPSSLYTEPASKAPVRLVKIDRVEQFNTDDQIRFVAYIVVQKDNVADQMVLKVLFFMEREDLNGNRDDRANFFEKKLDSDGTKIDNEQSVIIEQVFTEGFLSDDGSKRTDMDRFHNYGQVRRIDGTMDQSKVLKIMQQKHRERSKELSAFLCTVDDETKQLHDVPGIGEYESYKNTRTILDDLEQFPQHSFGSVPI